MPHTSYCVVREEVCIPPLCFVQCKVEDWVFRAVTRGILFAQTGGLKARDVSVSYSLAAAHLTTLIPEMATFSAFTVLPLVMGANSAGGHWSELNVTLTKGNKRV